MSRSAGTIPKLRPKDKSDAITRRSPQRMRNVPMKKESVDAVGRNSKRKNVAENATPFAIGSLEERRGRVLRTKRSVTIVASIAASKRAILFVARKPLKLIQTKKDQKTARAIFPT